MLMLGAWQVTLMGTCLCSRVPVHDVNHSDPETARRWLKRCFWWRGQRPGRVWRQNGRRADLVHRDLFYAVFVACRRTDLDDPSK